MKLERLAAIPGQRYCPAFREQNLVQLQVPAYATSFDELLKF